MHRLHITVVTPRLNRYPLVPAAKRLNRWAKTISGSVLSEAADEFRTIIGLKLTGFSSKIIIISYLTTT